LDKTSLHNVPGFRSGGISSGIKKSGAPDLALILSDIDAIAAGLFTKNRVKAAPVLLSMKRIRGGRVRGIIVNSGNANACTGDRGRKDAEAMASSAEEALGIRKGSILTASTGVIGVPLPVEKITGNIKRLCSSLRHNGLKDAGKAIMTTDAFPKSASIRVPIGGKTVTVSGIAKGAGMICPQMATMLAFILTDAKISPPVLKKALKEAAEDTFNSINVDNDTSTNDAVIALANGASGCAEIKAPQKGYNAFRDALKSVCLRLALLIVKDGEGATKAIRITVKGGRSASDARRAARTVAQSYLVKAAFFGGDPNWGRILAALGRSGARIREDRVRVSFNSVDVVRDGLDTGREKEAARAIREKAEVIVDIDLGIGRSSSTVWTSDLTYDYVRINSAYRT
jgi:glutamate N-acetyltransferase/amino-acid N-acetyltransferase